MQRNVGPLSSSPLHILTRKWSAPNIALLAENVRRNIHHLWLQKKKSFLEIITKSQGATILKDLEFIKFKNFQPGIVVHTCNPTCTRDWGGKITILSQSGKHSQSRLKKWF
jgi:hypothetical protein